MKSWMLALLFVWGASSQAGPPTGPAEVIALIGGSSLVAADQAGHLETFLVLRDPLHRRTVRSFAWEGDTVFSRPRPLNFPGLPQQLAQQRVTLALLQFGQMESLAGPESLGEFKDAYTRLIAGVQQAVRRVVLMTPTPFGAANPIDASTARDRNRVLALYNQAILEIGQKLHVPVIDLFGELSEPDLKPFEGTLDGVQLSARGHLEVARIVSRRDLGRTGDVLPLLPESTWDAATVEKVREAVVHKNRLWFRYWRPTNWAFLAGDRTDQPSSRDHQDRSIRWFPKEMEEFVPLIESADAEIRRRATHQEPAR